MPVRWTSKEELKFIKGVSRGKTFEQLSLKHDRSVSALELRLKKIIFDSINKKISANEISRMLNIPVDKVNQYYYSYTDFLESKGQLQQQAKKTKTETKTKSESENKREREKEKQKQKQRVKKDDSIQVKLLKQENKLYKKLLSDVTVKKYLNKMYKNKKLNPQSRKILEALIKTGLY